MLIVSPSSPMNEVVEHSLRHLDEGDLRAIAVYLKGLDGPAYDGVAVTPEQARAGSAIYEERCEECHGRSGRGGFFTGPALSGSAIVQGENPATLINAILYGSTIERAAGTSSWEPMPAYADALSDAEVAAVANFLRGSWGHGAAPVTPEDVRRQR